MHSERRTRSPHRANRNSQRVKCHRPARLTCIPCRTISKSERDGLGDGNHPIRGRHRVIRSASVADSTTAGADTFTTSAPEVPDCEQNSKASTAAKARAFARSIVWIAGVNAGKPSHRTARQSESEHCLLDPKIQGVVVGTTMNVINDEKVLHKLVFTKLGTHDTLTITPFFNTGQMVASERVAKTTSVVEVRCARHPWTRAYIVVFDHPYFAVTERRGNFTIDSLPPGNYTLMIWNPGDAKPTERPVQITAGGPTRIDVK